MLWKSLAVIVSVFFLISLAVWFDSFRKFLNQNSDKRLQEVNSEIGKYASVLSVIIFVTIMTILILIAAKYMV